MNIDELIAELLSASLALPGEHSEIDGEPVNINVCTKAASALKSLIIELNRKETSLATVSSALSYAESQAAEWRCKAGTLENELRRAELDKADLQRELEEARKDAERIDFLESECFPANPGNFYLEERYCGGNTFREAIDAARQQKG